MISHNQSIERSAIHALSILAFCVFVLVVLGRIAWQQDQLGEEIFQISGAHLLSMLDYVPIKLPLSVSAALILPVLVLIVAAYCIARAKFARLTTILGIAIVAIASGQVALYLGSIWLGVVGYAIGVCASFMALSPNFFTWPASRQISPWVEYTLVGIVILLSSFLRLIKLNTIPDGWDDELAILMSAATTWDGVVLLGLGIEHPICSPGFLWHFIHYVMYQTIGLSIFSERITGVSIGVLNLVVQYLVIRKIFGSHTALIALLLSASNCVEFEWSRLPNWHNLPSLIAVTTFYVSFRFLERPSFPRLSAVLCSCFVSMLCYPSGILPGLMPIIGAWILVLASMCGLREKRFPLAWAILLTVLGLPLWRCAESIIYFFYSGELRWIAISGTHLPTAGSLDARWFQGNIQSFISGLGTVLEYIFIQAQFPSHWAPLFGSAPPHTIVSNLVAALAVLGGIALLRCERLSSRSVLLLAWLPLSVAAALYSSEVETRRFGTLIPLIHIFASYGTHAVRQWLLAGFVHHIRISYSVLAAVAICSCGALRSSAQGYLSIPNSFPIERLMSERAAHFLEPGTILAVASHPFRQWKMFAMLLPDLLAARGQSAWASLDGFTLEDLVTAPRPRTDSMHYTLTSLREHKQTIDSTLNWSRLVIITDWRLDEEGVGARDRHESGIRAAFPQAEVIEFSFKDSQIMRVFRIALPALKEAPTLP